MKTRLVLLMATMAVLALTVLTYGPSASANDDGGVICTDDTDVVTGDVFGDVIIPAGQSCTVTNANVRGNVQSEGGSIISVTGSTIDGSIQIKKGSGEVLIIDNAIGAILGNVQIEERSGGTIQVSDNYMPDGSIQLNKNSISEIVVNGNNMADGNIQLVENSAASSIIVSGNTLTHGNGQIFKNISSSTEVSVNTIDGDLQCKENSEPFTATGNTVSGKEEDQCA